MIWLILAMAAQSAETRTAVAGVPPPEARASDLGWLRGEWTGPGIDGATASETYSAPVDDRIVGHFTQTKSDGSVSFHELIVIRQEGRSLVATLKHFHPDLRGWEDRDGVVRFPLVAIAPGALYFDGLTIRRDGRSRIVTAVRVGTPSGEREYVFRLQRAREAR